MPKNLHYRERYIYKEKLRDGDCERERQRDRILSQPLQLHHIHEIHDITPGIESF